MEANTHSWIQLFCCGHLHSVPLNRRQGFILHPGRLTPWMTNTWTGVFKERYKCPLTLCVTCLIYLYLDKLAKVSLGKNMRLHPGRGKKTSTTLNNTNYFESSILKEQNGKSVILCEPILRSKSVGQNTMDMRVKSQLILVKTSNTSSAPLSMELH